MASGHNRNLFFASTVACMSGSLFGYSVGFIGGVLVLPSFLHHFHLDTLPTHDLANAQALAVTSWLIGTALGVLAGMPVYTKLGRKHCLLLAALLYVIGTILQLVDFGGCIQVFDAGRFINGLGVGAGTLVSPLYISEISTPNLRGTLVSGYQVAIQFSALIGFWGAYVSDKGFPDDSPKQYQLPVALQLVPGMLLAIGTIFIPEAPRLLAERSKSDALRSAVAWLRGLGEDDVEVAGEVGDVIHAVKVDQRRQRLESRTFLDELKTGSVRRRLTVGIGLMIAQNMVGLNAVNYFAPAIFKSAGFTSVTSMLFLTGLFGAVKVIAALAFMLVFVRMKGDRFWLQLGSSICGISMLLLAICIKTMPPADNGQEVGRGGGSLTAVGILSVLAIYIFAFSFGVSLGPISWNVCGSIFPSQLAGICCTITTGVQWIFQIVIASITPPLIARTGWITYLVYAACCFASLIWCWAAVPETRGINMGKEMDELFADPGKADDGAVVSNVQEVEDVEDADETTQLLRNEQKWRRRSSLAFHV